ncbi:hypothetical protein MGYG_05315 [Nannizzia gypsea CBS 118893]|uniref:Uncharacterized protein n=1 Tax=Arthroderma gypseum (strain ATCC MYA-4604 / CBS 118893) TaxID=535722 RepID=E4UVJ1_ARTGP|nr:hypothetical protein MGYG_05315 [Nannizzia gypsea CBS 118893]EFR02318.1 hypothetical protein MGYG_05315 [Nannizzia gypsea CBS 118893]
MLRHDGQLSYLFPLLSLSCISNQVRSLRGADERELRWIDDYKGIVRFKLKSQFPWGWVIYRTSYSDEKAWQRMKSLIHNELMDSLKISKRMDLLLFNETIYMDDKAKFEGATSHDIRDHFNNWVADTLTEQMDTTPSEQQELRDPCKNESFITWSLGTRYNFCLFVDDICLESLDHMRWPVIKVLAKNFGMRGPGDRDYIVHPGWEDGETEEGEEEVGWMYTEVLELVSFYNTLMRIEPWYYRYCRPPSMFPPFDKSKFPGHWRKP